MRPVHAAWLWRQGRVQRQQLIVRDASGLITEIRPAHRGDPEALDGLVIPGLINAHTHLELSWIGGPVPGGDGFLAWIERLRPAGFRPPPEPQRRTAARAQARALWAAGTVAVSDLCNEPWLGEELGPTGLRGVLQREHFGHDPATLPDRIAAVQAINTAARRFGGLIERAAPHAPTSTPGALVQAAVGDPQRLPPASIHIAEDPDEIEFLASGAGAWAQALDRWGVAWRPFSAPGCSPVAWLHRLGVLGPGLLLVHGVLLDDADRALISAANAPLCLCPRSNLHISGRLPDVPALLAAGVRLCLGTDSLASCPDLCVLNEIPVLATAFPQVDPARWLELATRAGAEALGLHPLGRVEVGAAPGLVLVPGARGPEDLVAGGFAPQRISDVPDQRRPSR